MDNMDENDEVLRYVNLLGGGGQEEIVGIKGVESLFTGKYLRTDILDFWLNYVLQRNVHPNDRENITVLSSVLFPTMQNHVDQIYETALSKANRKQFFPLRFLTTINNSIRFATPPSWIKLSNENVLSKDYVFVPIHYSTGTVQHFFLAVICHPCLIWKDHATFKNDKRLTECEERWQSQGSKILLLDSLESIDEGVKSGVLLALRNFLEILWKIKTGTQPVKVNADNCPDYRPSVPRQPNNYDCGLFMVHYLAEFFRAPLNNNSSYHQQQWLELTSRQCAKTRKFIYQEILNCVQISCPEDVNRIPSYV